MTIIKTVQTEQIEVTWLCFLTTWGLVMELEFVIEEAETSLFYHYLRGNKL
jgi:hypothetical protein